MVNATKTVARMTVPVEPAPYPQPTSTPPGGGEWTWDTQVGQWVPVGQPAADAAQSE